MPAKWFSEIPMRRSSGLLPPVVPITALAMLILGLRADGRVWAETGPCVAIVERASSTWARSSGRRLQVRFHETPTSVSDMFLALDATDSDGRDGATALRIGYTDRHAVRVGEQLLEYDSARDMWTSIPTAAPVSAMARGGLRSVVASLRQTTGTDAVQVWDTSGTQRHALLKSWLDLDGRVAAMAADGAAAVVLTDNMWKEQAHLFSQGDSSHGQPLGPVSHVLAYGNTLLLLTNRGICMVLDRNVVGDGQIVFGYFYRGVYASIARAMSDVFPDGRWFLLGDETDSRVLRGYQFSAQQGGTPRVTPTTRIALGDLFLLGDAEGVRTMAATLDGHLAIHTTALTEGWGAGNETVHAIYLIPPQGKGYCAARWIRPMESRGGTGWRDPWYWIQGELQRLWYKTHFRQVKVARVLL